MRALRATSPEPWRGCARVVLAFAAAAGAFLAVTVAPSIVLADFSAPAGSAFRLESLSIDGEVLGWAYVRILGLTVLFGLPVWLVFRSKAWAGATAYASAAAVAADFVLFMTETLLHLPSRSDLALALWAASAGAVAGVTFQRLVRVGVGRC